MTAKPTLLDPTAAANAAPAGQLGWIRLMPGVFVVLWSTGFIGAKYGLPYAEPLTFLLIRLGLVAAVLSVVAVATAAPWPRRAADWGHLAVVGLMVHGLYLGCVFAAIAAGLPAGLTALVVGLQPLLTATLVGPLLGERVTGRQWVGLLLGLAGVVLVVQQKIAFRAEDGMALGLTVAALIGITFGTLYQKRFCTGMDLRSGTAIQYAATTAALGVLAPAIETMEVRWTGEFIFALAWLSLVLSVGAVFLLFALIRRGAAASVASLFYLVPPCTAVTAWIVFDEQLGPVALLGMAVAAAGVALANRG